MTDDELKKQTNSEGVPTEEKLYTIEEFVETFSEDTFIRKGQYVLVENRGTFAERTLSAYDTEIEAFRIKMKSKIKIDVVKADVKYVKLKGITFLYSYEEIQEI